MCTACGRLGDPIPVITADQEVVEVSEESNIAEPAAEDVSAEAPDAADVEPQEAVAAEPAAEGAPEVVSAGPSESSAGGILRRKPVLGVAVAGVAVAAAGIAVFALRRRRR